MTEKYFKFPFADQGDREAVPDNQVNTLVNYQFGYTPEYELNPDTDPDGNYIGRQRFNQVLYDATAHAKQIQDDGYTLYFADVSYKKGRIVVSNGDYYRAKQDVTGVAPPSAEWDGPLSDLQVRQATTQEALDGSNVDAYMPPDLVHAAFNQYGLGSIVGAFSDYDTPRRAGFYQAEFDAIPSPGGGRRIVAHCVSNDGSGFDLAGRSINNELSLRSVNNNVGGGWVDIIHTGYKATKPQARSGTNDAAYLTSEKGNDLLDMVGFVMYSSTDATPLGRWIKGNGFEVSRSAYADLFARASASANFISQATKDGDPETYAGYYGDGDGSTTFTLPDLRAEIVRGWDDGRGVDSGRAFGSFQQATSIRDTASNNAQIAINDNDGVAGTGTTGSFEEPTLNRSYTEYYFKMRNVAYTAWIRY